MKHLQILIRYSLIIGLVSIGVVQNGYAQFDITQASFMRSTNNPLSLAGGIAFSNDGLQMFIIGRVSSTNRSMIYQYQLSTAFDITTD